MENEIRKEEMLPFSSVEPIWSISSRTSDTEECEHSCAGTASPLTTRLWSWSFESEGWRRHRCWEKRLSARRKQSERSLLSPMCAGRPL